MSIDDIRIGRQACILILATMASDWTLHLCLDTLKGLKVMNVQQKIQGLSCLRVEWLNLSKVRQSGELVPGWRHHGIIDSWRQGDNQRHRGEADTGVARVDVKNKIK